MLCTHTGHRGSLESCMGRQRAWSRPSSWAPPSWASSPSPRRRWGLGLWSRDRSGAGPAGLRPEFLCSQPLVSTCLQLSSGGVCIRLWICACRLGSRCSACLYPARGRANTATGSGLKLLALLPEPGRLLSLREKLPQWMAASRTPACAIAKLP